MFKDDCRADEENADKVGYVRLEMLLALPSLAAYVTPQSGNPSHMLQCLINGLALERLILAIPLTVQTILGIPSLKVVGEASDRVESLPPRRIRNICVTESQHG